MSSHHPPITCADFKRILEALGFAKSPRKSRTGGSHEQWVGQIDGKFRKVTVDCPKAPFTGDLIRSMANQAGVTTKRIYEIYFSL